MKTFLLLSVIFLTACTKKNKDLGPDYDQFIGTWETINTSEKAILKFKKNGKIEISHAIERNGKFIITNLKFGYVDSATAWSSWGFVLGNSSSGGLIISPTKDSLISNFIINVINNGTLSYPSKKAVFIKK